MDGMFDHEIFHVFLYSNIPWNGTDVWMAMMAEVSKQAIDLNPLTIHRLLAAATVTWYSHFFLWLSFLVIFCLYGSKSLEKKEWNSMGLG